MRKPEPDGYAVRLDGLYMRMFSTKEQAQDWAKGALEDVCHKRVYELHHCTTYRKQVLIDEENINKC